MAATHIQQVFQGFKHPENNLILETDHVKQQT
jgi:hypothetical protein